MKYKCSSYLTSPPHKLLNLFIYNSPSFFFRDECAVSLFSFRILVEGHGSGTELETHSISLCAFHGQCTDTTG